MSRNVKFFQYLWKEIRKNCNGQEHCEMNLEDKTNEDFPIYSGFDVFQNGTFTSTSY